MNMKNINKREKMSKKIVNRITKILVFLILVQPVNDEESKLDKFNQKFNQKFSQKFSQIIQFLKNERKKTNDYQIKTWKEAKNENLEKIKIVQHKLTGFFSDFPER